MDDSRDTSHITPEQAHALSRAADRATREADTAKRETAAVRGDVDRLSEIVTQLAGDFAATLRGRRPGGRPGEDEEDPGLPSWLTVVETGAAVEHLADLIAWLDTVYLHYPDARPLPSCWAWHPDVVEELSWLRQAWREAFEGQRASWGAVGDWHTRLRPGVVDRVSASLRGCELDLHKPGGEKAQPPAGVPFRTVIEPLAHEWTTRRAQPVPTQEQLREAERHDNQQSQSTTDDEHLQYDPNDPLS